MRRRPVNVLISYHYATDTIMELLATPGVFATIGDSGAYSAMTQGAAIDIDSYAAWIKQWGTHLEWVANLDVIGDAAASHANWRYLKDTYGLNTVPTVHFGCPAAALDVYGKNGVDFVGLGGMVSKPISLVLPWLVAMFVHAKRCYPAMRFHGWGMTSQDVIAKLPFYSVDSTGLISRTYRYGEIDLWDPRRLRRINIPLNGRDIYAYGSLLRGVYGIDPAAIAKSHPGNKKQLVAIMTAGVRKQEEWLMSRFATTPPRWGIASRQLGTRLHIAEVGNDIFATIASVTNPTVKETP